MTDVTPLSPSAAPPPGAARGSFAGRILRASLVIFAAQVIVKLFSLIYTKFLGHYFGASVLNDSFLLAYEGVILILFSVGEKALGPAFVPVFIESRDADGEERAWKFAGTLLNLLALFLAVLVAGFCLFPAAPARFFAWLGGRGGSLHPGQTALAAFFVRNAMPGLLGLSLGTLTFSLLSSYKRFFTATIADAATRLILVGAIGAAGLLAVTTANRTQPGKAETVAGWRAEGNPLQLGVGEKVRRPASSGAVEATLEEPATPEDLRARLGDFLCAAPSPAPTSGSASARPASFDAEAGTLYESGWAESFRRGYRRAEAAGGAPVAAAPAELEAFARRVVGRIPAWSGARLVAWGIVLGGLAKLLIHLWALRDKLRFWRPRLALRSPRLRRCLWLMLPLLLGIVVARARDVVANFAVFIGEEGLITYASFGRKIANTVQLLVPYAIAVAMFPFFCEMVDRKDRAAMGEFLTRSTRALLLLFVPFAAGLAVLATPLASLIYEGGQMQQLEIAKVGRASACYILVIPAMALESLFMQAYFSDRRMLSSQLIGIVFSALSLGWSFLAAWGLGLKEMSLLVAVVLGYVASRWLKSLVLGVYLRRHLPMLPTGRTLGFLLVVTLIAAACTGTAWTVRRGFARLRAPATAAAAAAPAATPPAGATTTPRPDGILLFTHAFASADAAHAAAAALRPAAAPTPENLGDEAFLVAPDDPATGPARLFVRRGSLLIEFRAARLPAPPPAGPPTRSWLQAISIAAPELFAAGLAAGLVFLELCWLFRLEELKLLLGFLRQKLAARRARGGRGGPGAPGAPRAGMISGIDGGEV